MSTLEQMVDATLANLGAEQSIAVRSPTPLTVAQVVAETDIISVLPSRLASYFETFLPLQRLALPFQVGTFDVTMVWHERTHKDQAHHWLRQQFKIASRELRALPQSAAQDSSEGARCYRSPRAERSCRNQE